MLRFLSQLMELYDENTFKVRSISNAAFKIDKLPYKIAKKQLDEIEQIEGVGKSTAEKVWEIIQTGKIKELEELLEKTPAGIIEIMSVKGLGPKKVKIIWEDLGIESLGELLYACNENRLIEAKGFGLKTQEEIKKAIEFRMASSGRFLYARIEALAESLLSALKTSYQTESVSATGEYRRRCEIIDSLSFLVAATMDIEKITAIPTLQITKIESDYLQAKTETGLSVTIVFCEEENYEYQVMMLTGNEDHVKEVNKRLGNVAVKGDTEAQIYKKAGLPFIEPELREGLTEFDLADSGNFPVLIQYDDLKGTLHNHSTWSDGINTLENMAIFCRNELGLEYLGISDHSKSAFYANGLTQERVLAQLQEIDSLNLQLAPFKIFKGIESDILYEGALDYPDEILKLFDFVVASVHSILRMSEEKATERLIAAIENPYTTILGHPSGRMLLSRSGYPVDYKKIIDACAANNVVIEINSNPLRLDIDWRWHQYAVQRGVMLSVNPDAHRKEGFYDMKYGVFMARKGGLASHNCLNCKTVTEISDFFAIKNSARIA